MGKIIEQKINRWDGGIVNDPRIIVENVCRVVSNFDLTSPYKMTPYKDSEDGDSAASTSQKQNFCIALRSGSYKLFALGVISGTGRAEVLFKNLTTGGDTDLDDNGWDTPTNNQSAAGATAFNLFVYYAKTGLIYGARAGTNIWAFDPLSVAVWADSHRAITYANIAQGLVHSKDDILYIPYDNKIAKNDNGSWTDAAITLPSNFYITSICEDGNYLAIAYAPLSGIGNSVVYLWDRDSSVATLAESIDWSSGILKIIETIDGVLIGVSMLGGAQTTFNDKIILKYLSGNQAIKFQEIIGSTSSILLQAKQKSNNKLYFMMKISLNGATRAGVWSIGKIPNSFFTLVHERTHINDTIMVNGVLKGFFIVDDFTFVSYVGEDSNYALSKTNDASSYTATAMRETLIFNGGDSSITKKLLGVTVMTEALPAAGQVVLKYKKDEETSWTRIFLHGTDNSISHSAINIEIGQDTITMTIASPAVVTLTNHDLIAGQKIRFRTTGALPTGVTAGTAYYVISTGLTADSFQFSATLSGSAVNTSGTQSGTHTLEKDAELPEYKEIQFMIESTGNAVITGLKFKSELLDKDIY